MLTIHHLGISQCERILWLCEELGLPYKMIKHVRDPVLSPESLISVSGNKTGRSPFVEDSDAGITLSESGAICEYIINKYGAGKLALPPDHKDYSEYLHWFHYANGTLQMMMVCAMLVDGAGGPADSLSKQFADQRLAAGMQLLDDRLKNNKWLAGDEFTAADIMTVYCPTTQRYFGPQISLAPYPNLLRYLKDCAARPAYQRAMEKGDPDMELLLGAEPPSVGMVAAGGTKSDHWKKKNTTIEK